MQLPKQLMQQPRSRQLDTYIRRHYSVYGYRIDKDITYNHEFVPDAQKRAYSPDRYRWVEPDRYRWVENVSDGLRKVGTAHEINGIFPLGYYTDGWCDETVHGSVYQLPSRKGVEQYVPAVDDPNNTDCACLDFTSIADNKEDAASWADNMAESWAESEREARAKDDTEQCLTEIDDKIKHEYADFKRIASEVRANCQQLSGIAVVRELVRNHWKQTKATIRELRQEQHRLETDGFSYWH